MNGLNRLLPATCLLAAAVTAPATAQALELYDTFGGVRVPGIPGKLIDPQRWDAWNSHAALEVTRVLQGGKVVLGSVTHGGSDADSGRRSGRSSLPFPEAVGADITEIQAKVQTRKMGLTDCPANTDNGRLLTPRIGGHWFSDGTVPADDEDLTGTMWASLDIRRQNHHDAITDPNDPMRRSNRLLVIGQVFHCGEPNCSDGTTIGFETLGVIRRGQKRRVRMAWDEPGDRFVFQLQNNDPVEIGYDPALNAGPPPKFWKRIEHRGQPENCLPSGPDSVPTTIMGEVRVFDVQINADAIPD